MYRRNIIGSLHDALADTPVILINGARQTGKTTLVDELALSMRNANYATLDDLSVLEAATSDPVGFINGMCQSSTTVILDEIQRAPGLFPVIKASVDRDRRPGRFLLTGSANVLTLPRIADSLAGRMETIQMLPLARAEIEGRTATFLERLFEGKIQSQRDAIVGDDLVQLVLLGGFPEAISRESERRRQDWLRSYLTSILTRDLRDIAEVEKLTELPKFVRLLAEHSGRFLRVLDADEHGGTTRPDEVWVGDVEVPPVRHDHPEGLVGAGLPPVLDRLVVHSREPPDSSPAVE